MRRAVGERLLRTVADALPDSEPRLLFSGGKYAVSFNKPGYQPGRNLGPARIAVESNGEWLALVKRFAQQKEAPA